MTWQPISFADLQEIVAAEIPDARVELRTLFEEIRITPEKWRLPPWGDLGGGFWVVAVHRDSVLWYNDIEEGFNVSKFRQWGTIDEYWCNQDTLPWALAHFTGNGPPKLGPPLPVEGHDA